MAIPLGIPSKSDLLLLHRPVQVGSEPELTHQDSLRKRKQTPARLNASLMQPRATQSHLKATSKPPQSHILWSTEPPQGYPKATPRPPQGHPKATPRLPPSESRKEKAESRKAEQSCPEPGTCEVQAAPQVFSGELRARWHRFSWRWRWWRFRWISGRRPGRCRAFGRFRGRTCRQRPRRGRAGV